MDRRGTSDVGKLILRLAVGGLLLLHGIFKLRHGVEWMKPMLGAKGLPTFIAYGVYLGEVVGAILVLAGILSRLGGVLIALNMCMAIFLAHTAEMFSLNKAGGASIELDLLYLLGGVAIALMGPGEISVSRGRGRFD